MNRRAAVKQAVLTVVSASMARATLQAGPGSAPGVLTVDLDQWSMVIIRHKGRSINISPAEIFESLRPTT